MAASTAFADFPKVELHLHLDCSPSLNWARQFEPELTPERFHAEFQLTEKCRDLAMFLSRIPRVLDLMQTARQLQSAVYDLFAQLREDHVIYAEIRFAPLLHLKAGLTSEQVVALVAEAVAIASRETAIEARLILCTLRHFSQAQGMETVELVRQFRDQGVVGLDLAADEAGFPIAPHEQAFRLAEHWGMARTAHAGEALGPESVRETLAHLRPTRIGHGVRSVEDPYLVEELLRQNIHLEICPACNVLIDVFPTLAAHPVDHLLRAGISLSINTDGRTIPTVTLRQQYQQLAEAFGWGADQFHKVNRNALEASFLDDVHKQRLLLDLDQGYGHLREHT